jgi:hypothetical protein
MLRLGINGYGYRAEAQNTIIEYIAMMDERMGIVRTMAATASQEAPNE